MRRINAARMVLLKDTLMEVFESHRQFIQISATILSCGAAWWTYTARRRHNRKMEEKIERLDLHFKDNGNGNGIRIQERSRLEPIKKYLIVAGIAMVYGYILGFKRGKRSSMVSSGRIDGRTGYKSLRSRKYGTFVSPYSTTGLRGYVFPSCFNQDMSIFDSMNEKYFIEHIDLDKDDF